MGLPGTSSAERVGDLDIVSTIREEDPARVQTEAGFQDPPLYGDLSCYRGYGNLRLRNVLYDLYWPGLRKGLVPSETDELCFTYTEQERFRREPEQAMISKLRRDPQVTKQMITLASKQRAADGLYQMLIHSQYKTSQQIHRAIEEKFLSMWGDEVKSENSYSSVDRPAKHIARLSKGRLSECQNLNQKEWTSTNYQKHRRGKRSASVHLSFVMRTG